MSAKRVDIALSQLDYRLANEVSRRLRGCDPVERSRFFTTVVFQVVKDWGFVGESFSDHYRAICSILGQRGGKKKTKTPRKGIRAGVQEELFKIPFGGWPELRPGMTPEEETLVVFAQEELLAQMDQNAQERRDDLIEEAEAAADTHWSVDGQSDELLEEGEATFDA